MLFRSPHPPTAIFAANDLSAIGAMDLIRSHGLSVPDDFSIIGFDDVPQAATTHPALTTVRQPLREMGAAAARMLLAYIDNPRQPPGCLTMETRLIIRESCRALPSVDGSSAQRS